MKDSERLELLKEIGGTKVYEERRRESLKIMQDTENRRAQVRAPGPAGRPVCSPCRLPISAACLRRSPHPILDCPCCCTLRRACNPAPATHSPRIRRTTPDPSTKIEELSEFIESKLKELDAEKAELAAFQALDRQRRSIEYALFDKELTETRAKAAKVQGWAGGVVGRMACACTRRSGVARPGWWECAVHLHGARQCLHAPLPACALHNTVTRPVIPFWCPPRRWTRSAPS